MGPLEYSSLVIDPHAADQPGPRLTVVVPIYNVEDYLVSCLESLADQTFRETEVVLVDDGSPDSSGRIAEEFAAGRENWRVLHVENGGLGRARNIGLDHASADYIAFIDSDDVVPRDAFELMMHAIEGSGERHRQRWRAALRRRPHPPVRPAPPCGAARPGCATHVRAMPSLLYDTTAWNKIFRRAFLLEHGLRFPEGVYYEDIPLTVPAHFLARSVDLIEEPVYLWRERQTAEQSITQRRAEVRNLVDRMAAVSSVNDFLERTGETEGKRLHDHKVLTLDMALFLDVLHEGDEEFAETLVRVFREYLADVDPEVVAAPARRVGGCLPPHRRGPDRRAGRGAPPAAARPQAGGRAPRGAALRRAALLRRPRGRRPATRSTTSPASQPLVTGVRDVRWKGSTLEVDGHGFIDGSPTSARAAPSTASSCASSAAKAARRTVRAKRGPPTRRHGPLEDAPAVSYDGSGFLARIPATEVELPEGKDAAEYELVAQVATPGRPARVAGRLARVLGARLHPPRGWAPDGVIVVPGYRGTKMRIAARRAPAVVRDLRVEGEEVVLSLRGAPGARSPTPGSTCAGSTPREGITVRVERPRRGSGTARFPAEALDVTSRSLSERHWRLWLAEALARRPGRRRRSSSTTSSPPRPRPSGSARAACGSRPRHVGPVDVDPEPGAGRGRLHGRLLQLRERGVTGAILVDGAVPTQLTDFEFTPGGLELHGDTGGVDLDRLVLLSTGRPPRGARRAVRRHAGGPPSR